MDRLREDIGADLQIRKLLELKTANVADPSREEIATFYAENKSQFTTPESVRASHILVSVASDASAKTKSEK